MLFLQLLGQFYHRLILGTVVCFHPVGFMNAPQYIIQVAYQQENEQKAKQYEDYINKDIFLQLVFWGNAKLIQ